MATKYTCRERDWTTCRWSAAAAKTHVCSPHLNPCAMVHRRTSRICFEEDDLENLIEPCECRADLRYAHRECCQQWISLDRGTGKKNETCEICLKPWKVDFEIPEVKTAGQHRYERLMHTLTVAYFRKVCGTASAREMHALVTIGPHIRGGWTEWLQERERKMQTPLYKFQSWWSNKTKGWRQRRASTSASDSEEEEEDGAEEAGGGLAGRRDSSGCGCCTPSSVPAASDSENPSVAAAAGLGPRPPPGRVQVRGLAPAAAPAEAAGEGEAEASGEASAEDRGGQGQGRAPDQGGGGSCTAACCAEEAPSAPGPSTSAAPEPCREGCCKEEEEVEVKAQESPLPNVSAQSRAMPPLEVQE